MKDYLLEIDKLNVEYITDDAIVYALNDFSLAVQRGEKIGLVGETGAGKTTMALSILRLLPKKVGKITSGSIKYEGEELLDKPESYMQGLRGRRISMIFQDPMTSLNPVKTVGDQVLEVLDLHFPDLSKEEKNNKVDQIFTLVGIPPERKIRGMTRGVQASWRLAFVSIYPNAPYVQLFPRELRGRHLTKK